MASAITWFQIPATDMARAKTFYVITGCYAGDTRPQPEWLPADDFLANVSGWEMGIIFDTDIMGLQQFKVDERGPVPTAAAMLRDVINSVR